MSPAELREEFVAVLTTDGNTHDRRRKSYNQAIFAPESEGGYAVFTNTDLAMVLHAYDAAVKRLEEK